MPIKFIDCLFPVLDTKSQLWDIVSNFGGSTPGSSKPYVHKEKTFNYCTKKVHYQIKYNSKYAH